jgi:hypothetical protein
MNEVDTLRRLKIKLLASYDLLTLYHTIHKGTTLCSDAELKTLKDIVISVNTELGYQERLQAENKEV